MPTVTRLGAASLALGLMAAGAGLGLIGMAQAKTLGVAVLSITHLAMPLAAWVLAAWFGLSPVQTTILQAYSAVPTATSAYVLATPIGYDDGPVAAMVTLSTRLGCVSLPLAIELRNL